MSKSPLGRGQHSRRARAASAKRLGKLRGKERQAKPVDGTSFKTAVEVARRFKGKKDGGKDDK